MRKVLTLLMAGTAALSIGCASAPQKVVEGHSGTRRTLLAKTGEVHDALMTLVTRDPHYTVSESKDEAKVDVAYLNGNERWTLTAYLDPGPVGDQSDIEIVCQGPSTEAARRKLESDWLDKLPEAVKYLALDHIPDLRSPLDDGPRAELAPEVPSIDAARRY